MKDKHENFEVTERGLIKYLYLTVSPDGIGTCNCHGTRDKVPLQIWRPVSYLSQSIN